MNSSWTETELAYFAGIIDGEGCFTLHNFGTHRFARQLHVGNTDVRMLEWIRARFGGNVKLERRSKLQHKPVWRWYSDANNLDAVIAAVMPYLICKKDRAELMLAYSATLAPRIRSKRSTHRTSDSVKSERTRIHSELSILNRRGAA